VRRQFTTTRSRRARSGDAGDDDAGRTVSETKTIDVTPRPARAEFSCDCADLTPRASGRAPQVDVEFALTVAAKQNCTGARRFVRQSVPLNPYGMPVYATASGAATSDMTAWSRPEGHAAHQPSLRSSLARRSSGA